MQPKQRLQSFCKLGTGTGTSLADDMNTRQMSTYPTIVKNNKVPVLTVRNRVVYHTITGIEPRTVALLFALTFRRFNHLAGSY
jgi:hypothetical protein